MREESLENSKYSARIRQTGSYSVRRNSHFQVKLLLVKDKVFNMYYICKAQKSFKSVYNGSNVDYLLIFKSPNLFISSVFYTEKVSLTY